ncbi:hypothetical protein L210DRAFT_3566175 [Boletus edulis BED1]|uniref:Uncharacterized protein n=1 Tax=Boletus edulis BED1 TaxID=1328754 RepID=A0AAD4BF39_BOLED|nr:hypothetical protein L210DRAFT_3566175 [Boletus edulis BED1]
MKRAFAHDRTMHTFRLSTRKVDGKNTHESRDIVDRPLIMIKSDPTESPFRRCSSGYELIMFVVE